MSDTAVVKFRFRDMAEVDRAITVARAENWSGALCAAMLQRHTDDKTILTYEFTPYVWKVNKIRPPVRVMPDTWLTSLYAPRLAPNAKLP